MKRKGNPVHGHESQSRKKARPSFSDKNRRKGIHKNSRSGGKEMKKGWRKDSNRHKSKVGAFSKAQKQGKPWTKQHRVK